MADKDQGSDGKSRQKVVIGIFIIVAAFVGWQVIGMFNSKAAEEAEAAKAIANAPPPMPTPKPAELPKPAALTQREMELIQLQQETEAKYIAAVNELQMLKIQRDIAETNKAIANAKLDTVNSQKNIITLLSPDQSANYSQNIANPTQMTPVSGQNPAPVIPTIDIAYTVISVSEIQGQWGAILGAQGKLFSVRIGDVLPGDTSKVVAISKTGVVLEKDGVRKTISMVPII